MTIEGPPLSEIQPGIYELHMRDGSVLIAVVDRKVDGVAWYTPVFSVAAPSSDWSAVVGAISVSRDELVRRTGERPLAN